MSQITSFNNLSVIAFPLSQSIKKDDIHWDDCEERSITIREHVTLSRITEAYKRGASAHEYDLLFSAGLLLSAVVAFYLPFTYFTCQMRPLQSAVAPSGGERRERARRVGPWPKPKSCKEKLHSCGKRRNTAGLVFWQIGPLQCRLSREDVPLL